MLTDYYYSDDYVNLFCVVSGEEMDTTAGGSGSTPASLYNSEDIRVNRWSSQILYDRLLQLLSSNRLYLRYYRSVRPSTLMPQLSLFQSPA
jgi:hypothetical protein